MDRYIILSDAVIDREKVAIIQRDQEDHNRIWVYCPGIEKHYFDGADAREIWKAFDTESDWRS